MAALRHADVQPAEIRLLVSGEPGCDVVLYGRNYVYTIRMEPQKERSGLFALPLDSKLGGPGCELCVHRFAGTDYVGDILAIIRRH